MDEIPKWLKWLAGVITAIAVAVAGVVAAIEDTPTPEPVPSIPAGLPDGIGIDGAGVIDLEDSRPDGLPHELDVPMVAEPDTGGSAELTDSQDGIGGVAWMTSPIWAGRQIVTAGYRYPSGSFHGGLDIGLNSGTILRAPHDAVVLATNDGVANHPAGAQYAIPGSASNWVLLCARVEGRDAALYFQHMSPGVTVRAGQAVRKGRKIGKSGNTGFSTGPHLHLSSQWLRSGQTCRSITPRSASDQRYDYLRFDSLRIFSPARWWAETPATIKLRKSRKVRWIANRYNTKPYRVCKLNPTIRKCSPDRRVRAGKTIRVR